MHNPEFGAMSNAPIDRLSTVCQTAVNVAAKFIKDRHPGSDGNLLDRGPIGYRPRIRRLRDCCPLDHHRQ